MKVFLLTFELWPDYEDLFNSPRSYSCFITDTDLEVELRSIKRFHDARRRLWSCLELTFPEGSYLRSYGIEPEDNKVWYFLELEKLRKKRLSERNHRKAVDKLKIKYHIV